jgi:CubicO group peptidase (beta-lactamase class C family)
MPVPAFLCITGMRHHASYNRAVIDDFLKHEIEVGTFPSATYAIGSFHRIEREAALGNAVTVPLRVPATLDTLYDCASITKPLITATLALQTLPLDSTVLDFPHTVRSLLTHTSGLIDWLPLYAFDDPVQAIREHVAYEKGTRVLYSDPGFVLLWMHLEKLFGDFEALAFERIFGPLKLDDAMFRPPEPLRPRIAATEWGQRYEAQMARDRGFPVFAGLRQALMWGEVHDSVSHHIGKGVAGNAGLFATARAVFRLAQAWARHELLPNVIVRQATRNQTPGLNESRGFGWIAGNDNMAARPLSTRAYGHTGFAGTSVWIEPEGERIFVLLTNRVHPSVAPVAMQKVRAEFHRLALAK